MAEKVIVQNEVEKYLKENKIKKKDFAAELGISNVTLSHWLHGRTTFNIETVKRICRMIDL